MKTLAIIPARAGSRRIPAKNWRKLGGRPLVDYIFSAASLSTSLTDIVVTSDSPEVLALVTAYPDFHCILRPAALSTAESPAIDYVRHALEMMGDTYDAVVILQPTSPFTTPADIDATVDLLKTSGADSAVSVVEIPHDLNPVKFKVLRGNRLDDYLEPEAGRMAAHEMPKVYVRNGSVYAATISTIRAGQIIGPDCRGYRMPRERSVDINDEFDWKMATLLLQEQEL